MLENINKLIKDEEGATAVEYGLIVAAIAAVIITTVFALGDQVKVKFDEVTTGMTGSGG